jgi:hypothetical protein
MIWLPHQKNTPFCGAAQMIANNNEKTPLLKDEPAEPNSSSTSEAELDLIPLTHTNEETLMMFINTLRDAMLGKNRLLTDQDIESLTRLSLTCKSMYGLLSITNQASPFYYLPIDFFLEKTRHVLAIKSAENNKTVAEIKYLQQHILELQKLKEQQRRHKPIKRLFTKPPAHSSHWNHEKNQNMIDTFAFIIPFSITFLLACMNKLPGQEPLNNLFHKAHSKDEASQPSLQVAMGEILAGLIMFLAFSAAETLLILPALEFIHALLRPIWLKNAEKSLASLAHYPPEALQQYQFQYNKLNNNKLEISKHLTLTLFNKVSALKRAPIIDKKDIEAQAVMEEIEPRRRVNA